MNNDVKTGMHKIASNVIFLYIRMFFLMLIAFFTSRIVLDKLGIVDYGLYNVVGSLILLFSFVQGALSSAASRFLAYEIGSGTLDSFNRVFNMALNIHLLFAAVFLLFSESIGLWYLYEKMTIPADRFHATFIIYQFVTASSVLAILVVPYNAMIIAHEQMKSFAYLSIVEGVAKLGVAFLLFLNGFDKLILYGVLMFIVQISINSLYFLYCRNTFRNVCFYFYWDRRLFREMFVFSCWTICAYISTSVVAEILNLMLNSFFGPAVNAARAVAYQVQGSTSRISTNFQIAINPQIIKNYANSDLPYVEKLVNLSSKVAFILLGILFVPLLLNIDFFLSLWLVDIPQNAGLFVRLMCLSVLFASIANPFSVVAEASNKLKMYNLTTMPIYLLILPVTYLAFCMGADSYFAFLFTFTIEILCTFVKFAITKHILGTSLIKTFRLLIVYTISTVLFVALSFLLPDEMGLYSRIICIVLSAITAVTWMYIFILDNNEKKLVRSKIISLFPMGNYSSIL